MLGHLADVSVRALALAAVAAAVLWRRRSAAIQHAVWAAVAMGMLGLFVFGPELPKLPVVMVPQKAAPVRLTAPPASRVAFYGGGGEPVAVRPVARAQARPQRIDWSRIWSEAAAYLYLSVAALLLLRFAMGMLLAWRLSARSTRAGGFFESAAIKVPLTVGWLWPRILLPLNWREWDRDKLEAVIAHEGAHVRRRDGLVALLAGINRCLFWFHPLTWWMERRLGLLAELACDEACVAELGDGRRYANLLLEMARTVDGTQGRVQAFRMAASSHLRQRIDSILEEGRTFSRGVSRMAWALIGLCGVPVVLAAGTVMLDGPTPLPPLLMFQQPPYVPYGSPPPPPPPPPPRRAGLKFEVASIRPAAVRTPAPLTPPPQGGLLPPPPPPGGGACFPRHTMDEGRLDRLCTPVKELLLETFDVTPSRLTAPDWTGDERFDISAKLPAGATAEDVPAMLQSMLEERFGLKFHREFRYETVNALTVAKAGPKLKPAVPESSRPGWMAEAAAAKGPFGSGNIGGVRFRSFVTLSPDGPPVTVWQAPGMGYVRRWAPGGLGGIVHYEAPDIASEGLAALATLAGNGLAPPIVDRTGLSGRFQVNLDVSVGDLIAELKTHPGDVEAAHRAELEVVQAALKKLGLEIESRKMQAPVIVIDHLEKTPTEN